jgi:hypothetical protein
VNGRPATDLAEAHRREHTRLSARETFRSERLAEFERLATATIAARLRRAKAGGQ